jgi:hypothetical protein
VVIVNIISIRVAIVTAVLVGTSIAITMGAGVAIVKAL